MAGYNDSYNDNYIFYADTGGGTGSATGLATPTPRNAMPKMQVLAGFGATSASFPWTDISAYQRSGSVSRPSNRLAVQTNTSDATPVPQSAR